MEAPGAKGSSDRTKFLLAFALMRKNALPTLMKHLRAIARQIQVAIKYIRGLCTFNGTLRRVALARARQLGAFVAFLATQAAKWRSLIQFLALKTLKTKQPAPVVEPEPLPATPSVADVDEGSSDYEDSEEAINEFDSEEEELESVPSEGLSALAKYTNLDAFQTKESPIKQTRDSPYDKIPVGRRNAAN